MTPKEKLERPVETFGKTIKKTTGCGNLYITLAGDGNGNDPIELFTRLGKSGGCSECQNEALSRCISLGLKYGIPVEEFVDELIDIQCPSPIMFPKEDKTLSCPDAIARAMRGYTNGNNQDT